MNEAFRLINRIAAGDQPTWIDRLKEKYPHAIIHNGVLDINSLDPLDPVHAVTMEGESELEGDMGREWREVKRDNEGR